MLLNDSLRQQLMAINDEDSLGAEVDDPIHDEDDPAPMVLQDHRSPFELRLVRNKPVELHSNKGMPHIRLTKRAGNVGVVPFKYYLRRFQNLNHEVIGEELTDVRVQEAAAILAYLAFFTSDELDRLDDHVRRHHLHTVWSNFM